MEIIDRGSVNAFDDARTAHSIEATSRKKLIFTGLSLEVCAAFPAITAISKGPDAYVAVDACGTFNDTKRQLGIARLIQAGVIVSDYATLMMEVMKDDNPRSRERAFTCIGSTSREPWACTGSDGGSEHADSRFGPPGRRNEQRLRRPLKSRRFLLALPGYRVRRI